FLSLFLLVAPEAAGQHRIKSDGSVFLQDPERTEWGLFTGDEMIEVSLTFDITTFLDEKPAEEYLSAAMVLNSGRPDSLQLSIQLRARGNYRYRNCPFPPIRLNLAKASTPYSDLAEMDNLKMVTHCRDDEEYMIYILREYLIYRMYNIITENSFRVRLLRVHYNDTGSGGDSFTSLAFVIEPVDVIEKRLKLAEREEEGVKLDMLNPQNSNRLTMFQFMIANTDWFVHTTHNIKLFKPSDEHPENYYIAIPYDFDYSGFVNAMYALPRPGMNIEELRERTFAGLCTTDDEVQQILDEFKTHRKDLLNEISNLKQLDARHRIDLKRFVRSFYSLYHGDKIVEIIKETCIDQEDIAN
ncbi:MAG: hypothetical protein ABR519_06515, partial [Bacteroidales bacterium]